MAILREIFRESQKTQDTEVLESFENLSFEISKIDEKYFLICRAWLEINGRKSFGKYELTPDTVIKTSESIYIWKDDEKKEEKRRNTRVQDLQKKQNNMKIYQAQAQTLYEKIEDESIIKMMSRLSIVVRKNFNFTRIIFYIFRDKKLYPIFALAPEKKYRPSNSLLRSLYQKKRAIIFERPSDSSTIDVSMSIIQNDIEFGFLYPIFDTANLIAVFYFDSPFRIQEKNIYILSYLLEKMKMQIKYFYEDYIPPLEEMIL